MSITHARLTPRIILRHTAAQIHDAETRNVQLMILNIDWIELGREGGHLDPWDREGGTFGILQFAGRCITPLAA
jgi:hypothetical protein